MRRPGAAGALLIAAALACAAPASAATSQTWRQREKADFEKGEPKGVTLAAEGGLRLAPRVDPLHDPAQPYIWALARDGSGTIYAAGGNSGAILRLPASGKAALLHRVQEPEVHALAVDAAGNVYAGGSPGGAVYKIAPDGRVLWRYASGEEYIWALALDGRGGLFAATGVEGRILRIDGEGRGQVHFDSAETHVRALLPDGRGNLIAGTDGHGLVFRVSAKGEGFVLYDAPLDEIAALAQGADGTLYAAAIGETGRGAARGTAPPPPASPPGGEAPAQGPPSPTPAPPASAAGAQEGSQPTAEQRIPLGLEGRLLAISPDGFAREIWAGTQEAILSLATAADGTLLMGSSLQGRVYALRPQDRIDELARLSASSQITAMLSAAGGGRGAAQRDVILGGSNFGSVHALRPDHLAAGTFESRVLDARAFATWGKAQWRGDAPKGTAVVLSARCGNTEDPDRTWSPWRPLSGDAAAELAIDCPPARFLQWRADLSTKEAARTPLLEEVAITYLPRNLPPEIRRVEVQPPGVAFSEVPPQSASPEPRATATSDVEGGNRRRPKPQSRRGTEPAARSLTWQGSDPNDDDLTYDVYYRAVDERSWKQIRSRIDEEFVTLDGTALPDGTYIFRVVASDAPSNPEGQALFSEKTSERFDIDNSPPRVETPTAEIAGGTVRLRFAASDTFNIIREAAWTADAGEWRPVHPVDGVADSLTERFEVSITGLARGEHSLMVRVGDAAGNVAAGRAVVQVP